MDSDWRLKEYRFSRRLGRGHSPQRRGLKRRSEDVGGMGKKHETTSAGQEQEAEMTK